MNPEITSTRANHLIDPALHAWGVEVALYLFLGGMVAGLLVIAGLRLAKRPDAPRSPAFALAPWLAIALLSLGMLFLWLDLEHKTHVYRFYLTVRLTAPMSWGAWILLLIYPAAALLGWVMLSEERRTRITARLPRLAPLWRLLDQGLPHARPVALVTAALGVALGIYTGILLGSLAARPLWNSALLGPLFLTSGLSSGAALLLLARLTPEERVLLGRADIGLITAELVLIAAWLGDLLTGGGATRQAAALLLGGPYTAVFWTMVLAVGLVAPLFAELLERRHGVVPGRFAAVLVLAGGLALRWILVSAGQASRWTL